MRSCTLHEHMKKPPHSQLLLVRVAEPSSLWSSPHRPSTTTDHLLHDQTMIRRLQPITVLLLLLSGPVVALRSASAFVLPQTIRPTCSWHRSSSSSYPASGSPSVRTPHEHQRTRSNRSYRTTRTVTASSNDNNDSAQQQRQQQQSPSFTIEKVSSRERALDVHVFRGWSLTADEYIQNKRQQQIEESGAVDPSISFDITHEQAVKELMRTYDENGINTLTVGNEPLITFCAIYRGDNIDEEENEWIRHTNGVVGTVDCQVKTKEKKDEEEADVDSAIPWPHLYRKNLCVDPRMRRRGMALALVRAVKAYGIERKMKAIVLDVDPANESGAIQLNKREGFEFVKEGVMVCPLD